MEPAGADPARRGREPADRLPRPRRPAALQDAGPAPPPGALALHRTPLIWGDDPPETPRWLKAPFLRHGAFASPVSVLRARARRLPSCMAWTRAIGIARPSSIRSALSDCGPGICPAQGALPASSGGAVRTVKSPGATRSSSSHGTGNETGAPGRTRGL